MNTYQLMKIFQAMKMYDVITLRGKILKLEFKNNKYFFDFFYFQFNFFPSILTFLFDLKNKLMTFSIKTQVLNLIKYTPFWQRRSIYPCSLFSKLYLCSDHKIIYNIISHCIQILYKLKTKI